MGRKRRLSLSFKSFTAKCKALSCVDRLRVGQTIGIAAIVLFATCVPAQTGPAAPDQTERRIDSILSQMTIEEKIDLLGGVDDFYLRGVPRLGVPRFRMADGPLGVRNDGPATTMAGGIGLSATWDPALAQQVGAAICRDAPAQSGPFLLG